MIRVELEMTVSAPIERCFDLSRSIDMHLRMQPAHEAIAGVTRGLIGEGETVTWKSIIFGLPVTHTSIIDAYERPRYFSDAMVQGAFSSYRHEHFLESAGVKTFMRDVMEARSPLGPLGVVADWLFVERFLTRLLQSRNEVLKRAAESEEWRQYLPPNPG